MVFEGEGVGVPGSWSSALDIVSMSLVNDTPCLIIEQPSSVRPPQASWDLPVLGFGQTTALDKRRQRLWEIWQRLR